MNIISPINQLGYGIAGLNIVKHLSQNNRVALWPLGQIQVTSNKDVEVIKSCLNNAIMPNFSDPCIRIWHQHDMSQFVGYGPKIGFPFFELSEFNDIEKHHLNHVDKLFVTSSWAKDVCINNLSIDKNNIHIVPLGVDTEIFKSIPQNKNTNTIFFNCGKWEIRKGHDILCDIFNKAFDLSDNVELWLMTSNPFLNEIENKEWRNLYSSSKLGNKIKFIDRVETQKEVYNIMSQSDCGIFPSRAEGWNLELLEMLACGKHIIATNYSAHTEFCNEYNSRLVNISETEIAFDGKWFHGKCGAWAKITKDVINQFVDHMRDIHKLKQNNILSINDNGIKTANMYTWHNTINSILEYTNVKSN